jgi:hypothetical protein
MRHSYVRLSGFFRNPLSGKGQVAVAGFSRPPPRPRSCNSIEREGMPVNAHAARTVADEEQTILFTILAELETLAGLPDDAATPLLATLCAVGLPFAPGEWFGYPLEPRQRMAFSRAARRLAARGLVRRVTETHRDRTVALVPTADGLAEALNLAGTRANRRAVREGLRRTQWGRDLVRTLGGIP